MIFASNFCISCIRKPVFEAILSRDSGISLGQHHESWNASVVVDHFSCNSAKSIGANRPWIALNVSHRLQHNSRSRPANQQDGVAQRQPKRDQGWILPSQAPCVCEPSVATALVAKQCKSNLSRSLSERLVQSLGFVNVTAIVRRPCRVREGVHLECVAIACTMIVTRVVLSCRWIEHRFAAEA
jgi:hypothetical protein